MWCQAGPFSARRDDGELLYESLGIAVPAAALTVLEGPSGSGKTTLLRQLVGLAAAPAAARRLGDRSYCEAELPQWRARVTLLAQDAPMLAESVAGNLRLGFTMKRGRGCPADEARLRELLERSGLGRLDLERDASGLSGGERHRVALVRGLLWDPPLLVADEPLSGIDADTADACWQLLLEQARRPGRAVLAVLHDGTRTAAADHLIRLTATGEAR